MNVMLHNMALACKCTDIAPHPVHNDILKLGRAQYNNNEWYQSGPVCLLGVCWNAVCVCVHVCVCMFGATLYHGGQEEARRLLTQPHGPLPLHHDWRSTAPYYGEPLIHIFLNIKDTLFKHTKQSLPVQSPGSAQRVIAHFSTMYVNSSQCNAK